MANATLTRGSKSVSLPLVEDSAGQPLVARDFGKPHQRIDGTGALEPRNQDQWSGLEQYTLLGKFTSSSAYTDAQTLAELIKSQGDGDNPLTLDIDMPEYDSGMIVAPAAGQEESVAMSYPIGYRNRVDVDLALTRVDSTEGSGNQTETTPTASGSGPITLISADGSTQVELTKDIQVERAVGRPNDVIRRRPGTLPYHVSKQKTGYDAFSLSAKFSESTITKVQTLVDMFQERMGRDSLTLDFNGLYGYGQFDVTPMGSRALRHVRPSGYGEVGFIPTLNLRRVLSQ